MTDEPHAVDIPPFSETRSFPAPNHHGRLSRGQAAAQRAVVDELAQVVRNNLDAMRHVITDASAYQQTIDDALAAVGKIQTEAGAVLARRIR